MAKLLNGGRRSAAAVLLICASGKIFRNPNAYFTTENTYDKMCLIIKREANMESLLMATKVVLPMAMMVDCMPGVSKDVE